MSTGLKRHADKYHLALDESNEILKLAYDGKVVFVVPAFRGFYWNDRSHIDEN